MVKTLKENKGFSLIELIVTIAIIAIVVVPFFRSFFLAQDLDTEARRIQNATIVGQDIMEQFKSKDIESMVDYSTNTLSIIPTKTMTDISNDKYDRTYPKYTFSNWKVTGADGEDYYVDITVDAKPYTSQAEGANADKKNAVNSMTVPEFSSLFGSDAIMLFKQYTDPDNNLETYFRATGNFSEAELRSLSPSTLNKSTYMDIKCNYDSATGQYTYDITLNMTYSFKNNNAKKAVVAKTYTKSYANDEGHAIYLMLPVFDNTEQTLGTNAKGYYYSSDKFEVNYYFNGPAENQANLSLYIAQQDTKSSVSNLVNSIIKSDYVKVNNGTGDKLLYAYNNSSNKFKVYTNIEKSSADTSSLDVAQGLTYSEKSDKTMLYEIKVDVKYEDKDGDVIATFTSSKED